MSKASRVMYTIANFFTWIILLLAAAGIVLSALEMAGILHLAEQGINLGLPSLLACIFLFIVSMITIAMVRRAKSKGTSKAWDVFFMIVGLFGGNIFYFFGGLFGIIARE